jgi:hypothetical protein
VQPGSGNHPASLHSPLALIHHHTATMHTTPPQADESSLKAQAETEAQQASRVAGLQDSLALEQERCRELEAAIKEVKGRLKAKQAEQAEAQVGAAAEAGGRGAGQAARARGGAGMPGAAAWAGLLAGQQAGHHFYSPAPRSQHLHPTCLLPPSSCRPPPAAPPPAPPQDALRRVMAQRESLARKLEEVEEALGGVKAHRKKARSEERFRAALARLRERFPGGHRPAAG